MVNLMGAANQPAYSSVHIENGSVHIENRASAFAVVIVSWNNENLLAVKLEIYQNQAGSLGLPLLQLQKTPPQPKAQPDKQ